MNNSVDVKAILKGAKDFAAEHVIDGAKELRALHNGIWLKEDGIVCQIAKRLEGLRSSNLNALAITIMTDTIIEHVANGA